MKYLFLLFLLTIFCSCHSSFPSTYQLDELKVMTKNEFKEKYKITSSNSNKTLDQFLFKEKDWIKNAKDSITHVSFDLEYHDGMRVSFFQNEKEVKSKILRGEYVGKYFVFKTQVEIPLFTLVFNVFRENSSRISILKNGNLTLDNYGAGSGCLVVFPMISGEGYNLKIEFEKIKSQK